MDTYRFGPGVAIGYIATVVAAIALFFGLWTGTGWLTVLAIVLFVVVGAWWLVIRRRLFPHEGRQRNTP
ncbi:hypothetical protein [Williamsia sterculiae]|uniref:Uncharacterized protein n=1 Tax=Williamsia sterculiae TaxID=1344003 RepID=A0A1N7FLF9_9NOCA|nr:hypothetical protein [Williamsia sterculiae]SIS01107.1 hypothetical protein SAMN05445060_2169 [Williamsia sterculiae]